MKQFVKVLIVFVIFISMYSVTETSKAAVTEYNATVNTVSLSVREKPSISSKKLGTFKKGTKVIVFSKTSTGWSQITYKSRKAYVSTKYLKFAPTYSPNRNKIYVYYDNNAGVSFVHKYFGTKNGWDIWNVSIETANDKLELEQEKFKEDRKGMYINLGNKTTTQLRYPLALGKTWSGTLGNEIYTTKVTSLNKTVKTKAGTFTNVVELTTTNKGKTYVGKAYFAPNVGLIKSNYSDKVAGMNETQLVQLKNR